MPYILVWVLQMTYYKLGFLNCLEWLNQRSPGGYLKAGYLPGYHLLPHNKYTHPHLTLCFIHIHTHTLTHNVRQECYHRRRLRFSRLSDLPKVCRFRQVQHPSTEACWLQIGVPCGNGRRRG